MKRQNKISSFLIFIIVILCSTSCFAGTPDQWKARTIYQLLTDRFSRNDGAKTQCSNLGNYCGGGYKGIMNNLDYIQGMGFDAIWISPIVQNREGGYHGYWATNINKLNTHFGTEQQFKDLIAACHAKNIWVMVDVVANHMGNTDQNFSGNVPFNQKEHYHDFCTISDQDFATHNQNKIQNCRLANLADLKQQNTYVKSTLLTWISNLVKNYKIDGLRIDTVPEVPKSFWKQFTQSSGVYTVGQVFDGSMSYTGGYVGNVDGILNYPFFFQIRDIIFNSKDMYGIRNYYNDWAKNIDANKLNYMANFVDNHDNARTMSWSGDYATKVKHYKTTHVMALTSVGIPIVYYGAEQLFVGGNDPHNRQILWNNLNKTSEMYLYLKTVIEARKKHSIWNEAQVQRYVDAEFFSYSRGKFLVCLTNKVSGTVQKFISYQPFTNGQVVCNIFYPTTDCLTVNNGFNVYLVNGQAKIYVPK